jgi:hypothetical protein
LPDFASILRAIQQYKDSRILAEQRMAQQVKATKKMRFLAIFELMAHAVVSIPAWADCPTCPGNFNYDNLYS